jgi:hypothetical protein
MGPSLTTRLPGARSAPRRWTTPTAPHPLSSLLEPDSVRYTVGPPRGAARPRGMSRIFPAKHVQSSGGSRSVSRKSAVRILKGAAQGVRLLGN